MISEMLKQLTDELGYAYKRASDAEAALAEKDAEIARLRKALKSIASGCYTRDAAAIIAIDALEAKK